MMRNFYKSMLAVMYQHMKASYKTGMETGSLYYSKIKSASIFYTLSIAVGSRTSAKSVAGLTLQLTYDP